MKNFTLIFLLFITTANAQSTDYNVKKGFIANGFDVVAYFDNKVLEGNKKFASTHDGVSYKFSSQKNLELFNKNPKKYIPQYGGYCAYAVAIKADKIGINPESFEIRNNKLYLFYNAWGTNTLKLWQQENPEILIKTADKNWQSIKSKK